MQQAYDAIIVGARCAGSPTAMLLARKGYRVLVVDRATFPSDTVSTHVVQPLAVAALARWGLLDRLTATGCPPIHTYAFDFGPVTISGAPGTTDAPVAYCPRRTVLDKLLVDAAAEAGAEIREGFTVEEVLIEDGRVVGIKGHSKGGGAGHRARHRSSSARMAGTRSWPRPSGPSSTTRSRRCSPPTTRYWSGLPMDGRFETYIRPHRGFAAAPTHDGLTLTVGGWPYAEFEANKKDVEGNFLKMFDLAPEFAERVRGAKREAPFAGAAVSEFLPQAVRSRLGAGGRRGLQQGPDHGAGDQRRLPRRRACAIALDQAFTGGRSFDEAMGEYQRARDEHVLPMYEFTCQLATLEPPPPEMQQLLGAIQGNQKAMDGFAQMNAGTISPAEFGAIVAAAHIAS